jgi:tellurite resistance protein
MNWLITLLLSALLAASVAVARADESADKRSRQNESEKRKKEEKGLIKGERESREARKTNNAPARGDWEKRREQMKHMSPEERIAKRKEIKARLEKRIAELRARQSNGTLSPQETRELERREQILKRFESENQGGTRIERPKPVFTNSPLEK